MSDDDVISIYSSDEDVSKRAVATKNYINKEYPSKNVVQLPKQMFTRTIGAVDVSFPVTPYGCQVALASQIIQAIKKRQNCILESPTGSGKTLALLCATLAWQQLEKKNIEKLKNSEPTNAVASEKPATNNGVNGSKDFDQAAASNERKRRLSDEDPSVGLVKIHKRFCAEGKEDPSKETGDIDELAQMCIPKIYYGSRTHAQLKQVIEEFKRTPYCGKDLVQMSVLSSRSKVCVRERDTAQWPTVDDMCRKCTKTKKDGNPMETYCSYFDKRKNLLPHMRNNYPAFDLEDLKVEGVKTGACPYYGARELAKTADIIFCPYNYLLDPNIRERLSINLTDNIVIVDEAHNIENICRDVQTFEIRRDLVDKALLEIEKMCHVATSPPYIATLRSTLVDWQQWFHNHAAQASNQEFLDKWQTEHFIESLNNHNIGRSLFHDLQDGVERLFQRYQENPESLPNITDVTVDLLKTITTALQYILFEHGADYKPSLASQNGIQFLKLECLNPSLAMEGIRRARCLVLASGTLSPLDSFQGELGTDFPLRVSLPHVVPRDRVWIGSLTHDERGQPLVCTAGGAGGAGGTGAALGRALLAVCRVTPHAVLIVLPSYRLLNELVDRWKNVSSEGPAGVAFGVKKRRVKTIWDEMVEAKHVIFESKNPNDHDEVMKEFCEMAPTDRGALLFAIHRGKVSEGMDLKDRQARCVVCIGIPYPNLGEVKPKREYNDKNAKDPTRNLVTGSQWYNIQAYRALNQAVGRCVRHRRDWGAVLLVDRRFADPGPRHNLPSWVQKYMDVQPHSTATLVNDDDRSLKSFMERMKLEDEEA